MIGWVIIFAGLYFSWRYTDITTMTTGADLIAPFFFVAFLLSAIVKYFKPTSGYRGAGSGGSPLGRVHGGSGSPSGGDGGGDGGGC